MRVTQAVSLGRDSSLGANREADRKIGEASDIVFLTGHLSRKELSRHAAVSCMTCVLTSPNLVQLVSLDGLAGRPCNDAIMLGTLLLCFENA